MAECSECGEKSMSFKCHYCGEQFCSKHRLPEKHNCEGLESGKKDEWFEDKFSEKKDKTEESSETVPYRTHRKSLSKDIINSLTNSYTLLIIGFTVLSYMMQTVLSGYFDFFVLNPEISQILQRPWSLFSVMILHAGAFHLFANMITFYFFGKPVERLIGGKELLKKYIISGLVASIAYVAFYNLLILIHGSPETAGLAVGASGAVVAMVGMVAMLYPDAEVLLYFIIPMKIKTAVYAFGALETFNLITKLAGTPLPILGNFASSAHLAGLLIGIYYGKKVKEKYDVRRPGYNPLAG